ncbi:hypothetical protein M0R45_036422 [Rubus argutus]|uniref:Uncharacterized protein n=1 Tax=Rubus argutus TaxID=59490 RepID=A0AAW1VXU8_RUBAR
MRRARARFGACEMVNSGGEMSSWSAKLMAVSGARKNCSWAWWPSGHGLDLWCWCGGLRMVIESGGAGDDRRGGWAW